MADPTWRVVVAVDVRQAPSPSSALLFVAQPGKLLTQFGKVVEIPNAGRRVPVLPRGWVDETALELVQEETRERSSSELVLPSTSGTDILRQTSSSEVASSTQEEETCTCGALFAPESEFCLVCGQSRADAVQELATRLEKAKSRLFRRRISSDQSTPATPHTPTEFFIGDDEDENVNSECATADALLPEKEIPNQWQKDTSNRWQDDPSAGEAAWNSWRGNDSWSGRQNWRSTREEVDAKVRFAGQVSTTADNDGCILLESVELLTMHGVPHISVQEPWPVGVDQTPGSLVGFAVDDDGVGGKLKLDPGSICPAESNVRWAGTFKATSHQKNVGWISCLTAQRLYGSDVYLYMGNGLPNLRTGDIVEFQIHVNQKGKPQAKTGSLALLKSRVAGRDGPQQSIDATSTQIGRTMAFEYPQHILPTPG